MNKPTKASLVDLRCAEQNVLWVIQTFPQNQGTQTLGEARERILRVIAQITQDEALPCGAEGCKVVKPTVRAISAHRNMCLRWQDQKRRPKP